MKNIKIEDLSKEIMKELDEYKKTTTDGVKKSVRKISNFVKREISSKAPKDRGKYSKGWRVKKTKETGKTLSMTVYTPTGYRLSHLLEYGHAKRGGGRVSARVHIKPAEDEGIKRLEKEIKETFNSG